VHFFDAWTRLPIADLARLSLPLLFLFFSIALPGPRPAALAALGVAAVLPLLPEVASLPLRMGWALLWLAVAFRIARPTGEFENDPAARPGGVESGGVGVLLGLSLLVLLTAAIARQDLVPDDSRRISFGVALLCLGLVHLMVRRHLLRAAVAFAALGLGLEVIRQAAIASELNPVRAGAGGVLLATALAVAMLGRLADVRERAGGTAWVSQAHDLHD
jgi:hypothetical protein